MTLQAERIADLEMLNEIAQVLNQTTDIHQALHISLAKLVELMGLETGWIFLHDPGAQERWAGREFVLAAHHNLPPALALHSPKAWDKGCNCQTLCQEGQLEEAYNEIRCSRLADAAEAGGNRRGLVVHASTPLRARAQVLGILNVAAPEWAAFTPRTLALLSTVGSQMGIAIDRARLYEMLQEQRIHEQAALLELSHQLLSQVSLDDLMNFIVDEVRQLLKVDACALLLPDEHDPDWLVFRAASGWRSDPVGGNFRVPADERSNSGAAMLTQQPVVMDDTENHAPEPWMLGWLREEGFRAAAIVPLIADGMSRGAMVVDAREPRQFDETEIRFLQLMANQAAIAIENARLQYEEIQRTRMERELALGRQIQQSMLPKSCPEIPGWDLAAAYESARQVGGDFYDLFELPDEPGSWGIVIADVSDKGVPAALFMVLSRTTIRNAALPSRPPADALLQTNRYIRDDSQSDMFLSAFYAVLRTRTGRIGYCNAGHNPPLWWRASEQSFQRLRADGIVLGVLEHIELEEHWIEMAPGDFLILYTDGVTEAVNERLEEFGAARLETAVARAITRDPDISAQGVVDIILQTVQRHSGVLPRQDDTTLCIIKRARAA